MYVSNRARLVFYIMPTISYQLPYLVNAIFPTTTKPCLYKEMGVVSINTYEYHYLSWFLRRKPICFARKYTRKRVTHKPVNMKPTKVPQQGISAGDKVILLKTSDRSWQSRSAGCLQVREGDCAHYL